MEIKLVVADDHPSIRSGIAEAFRDSRIEIAALVKNGAEALRTCRIVRPDVLIIDVQMPGRDGLFAIENIVAELPLTKIIVYSIFDNPTYVARAITLGVKDYLLKSGPVAELVSAVHRVATEANPSPGTLVQQVRKQLSAAPVETDQLVALTIREMQVLRHVAFGLSNREIGTSLEISVETVKEHVQNILRKVQVSDRTQAAVWAVRNQIV